MLKFLSYCLGITLALFISSASASRHLEDRQDSGDNNSSVISRSASYSNASIGAPAKVAGVAIGIASVAYLAKSLWDAWKSADEEDESEYSPPPPHSPSSDDEQEDQALLERGTIIDLSCYAEDTEVIYEAARVDLHPDALAKENPRKFLRQKIFELQKLYHGSKDAEHKVHIITGPALKRSKRPYTLQNNVGKWLGEDYIRRRIQDYWLAKAGFYTVILRKNILSH